MCLALPIGASLVGGGTIIHKENEVFHLNRRIIKASLLLAVLVMVVLAVLAPTGAAFAANPPGRGQPGQDCEAIGVTPGHAASAPGSAFNPNGHAGTVY